MQKKQEQKTSAEAASHRKKEFMGFLFCRNGSGAKKGRVGNAARSFFVEIFKRIERVDFEGATLNIIFRKDLLDSKKAAERLKDPADAEELGKMGGVRLAAY